MRCWCTGYQSPLAANPPQECADRPADEWEPHIAFGFNAHQEAAEEEECPNQLADLVPLSGARSIQRVGEAWHEGAEGDERRCWHPTVEGAVAPGVPGIGEAAYKVTVSATGAIAKLKRSSSPR